MKMLIPRTALIMLLIVIFCAHAYAAAPAKEKSLESPRMISTGENMAAPPAPEKHKFIQKSALIKGLDECKNKLDLYKTLSSQLINAPCNRFSTPKYLEILQVRENGDYCRNLLVSADAKSKYQYADSIVLKFAEGCECSGILENVDANITTLNTVSQNQCSGYWSEMFETAKNNLVLEASDWDKKCKGIVSSSLQAAFFQKHNTWGALVGSLDNQCWKAKLCTDAFKDYKTEMDTLVKIAGDHCQGKLHETLDAAVNARGYVIKNCQGPLYNPISQKMNQLQSQYSSALSYCSSKDIVMNERCAWTRTTTITVHKQTGTFSKDTNITINEHWCKHDADYPWCVQYGTTQVKWEHDYYILYGSKSNVVTLESCVPKSEWTKCKGYTSSGQCIPN